MLHGFTIGRNKPEENKKKYEAELKSMTQSLMKDYLYWQAVL